MSDGSSIGWTGATWNPWTGCSKVSPGCDNCYAEAVAERWRGQKGFPEGFGLTIRRERFDQPRRWRKPRRIFVNSMSDMFIAGVPDEDLIAVWKVMVEEDRHTYQILTKRPGFAKAKIDRLDLPLPPHIWLGVSVEDQERADIRIPALLQIPAPVQFLSCEPLLGLLALGGYLEGSGITWVIDGGESGTVRRPADPDWFRAIRDSCLRHGVPYFHKQGNDRFPGKDRELDGVTWDEVPSVGSGVHGAKRGATGLYGVWAHLGTTEDEAEASQLQTDGVNCERAAEMSEAGSTDKVLSLVEQADRKLEDARHAYSTGEPGASVDNVIDPMREALVLLAAAVEEMARNTQRPSEVTESRSRGEE